MRRRRYAIVGVCPNGSMAHPDKGFIPSKIQKNDDYKVVTSPIVPLLYFLTKSNSYTVTIYNSVSD